MKISTNGLVIVAALAFVVSIMLMCARGIEKGLEKRQQELIDNRKAFMQQCVADGYTRTKCKLMYQEVSPLDGVF